jgi:hypothetical protein
MPDDNGSARAWIVVDTEGARNRCGRKQCSPTGGRLTDLLSGDLHSIEIQPTAFRDATHE